MKEQDFKALIDYRLEAGGTVRRRDFFQAAVGTAPVARDRRQEERDDMAIVVDLVTQKLEEFLRATGDALVREARASLGDLSSPLVLPQGEHLTQDPDRVSAAMQKMEEDIGRLCARNDFARLLVLFRKMPHEMVIARNQKGEVFELAIVQALKKQVQGVSHVKHDVKIKHQGQLVWQIDVGFILHDILFLVEAKSYFKTVAYYFEGTEVHDRVQSFKAIREKQDHNLRKYMGHVREAWREHHSLRGAICLVCSDEVEFTVSCDEPFWLDRALECPRICLPAELIQFLRQGKVEQVPQHPAFVPFP